MASLKLLITAVGRRPRLREQLVGRFVREDVIHRGRGHELIVHCFTNMDYEASKVSPGLLAARSATTGISDMELHGRTIDMLG